MSDPKFPGLNYETPLGITDYQQLETVYTEEFLKRMRLVSGGAETYATVENHGIVDELDPRSIGVSSTSDARPLQVRRVSEIDTDTVVIKPGIAVTPSGHVITILPPEVGDHTRDLDIGKISVVYVEYEVSDNTDTVTVTRYNTSQAKRLEDVSTVKVALLTDYQNPSIFTPTRLRNIVVLAVCTVTASGSSLTIDVSQTTYTFNRPWFSAVDIEHRNLKGTGVATTPHSLGLNDLSSGSMTLYQQLLRHGAVVGRDKIVAGVPGHLCTETIPAVAILTDDGIGTVTGTPNAKYVRLTQFITRVIGARGISSDYPVAVRMIEGTNIVVLDSSESNAIGSGFIVYGATVDAAQPATQVLSNDELTLKQPIKGDELIVAGGKALDTLGGTVAKFGTSAPIPAFYDVFVMGDGQPLINPQVVKCPVLITTLGSGLNPFDSTSFGPGFVRVGIAQGSSSGTWLLEVKVFGKDATGTSIDEVLVFAGGGGGYTPPVIPSNNVGIAAFKTTTQVFHVLENIQITNSANLTGNEILTAYVQMNPVVTPGFVDLSLTARALWNGQAVSRIHDTRSIITSLSPAQVRFQHIRAASAPMIQHAIIQRISGFSTVSSVKTIAVDDFTSPTFIDYRRASSLYFYDRLVGHDLASTVQYTLPAYYVTRAISFPSTTTYLILAVYRPQQILNEGINRAEMGIVSGQLYSPGAPTTPLPLGPIQLATPANDGLLWRLTDLGFGSLGGTFKIVLEIPGEAYGFELIGVTI